MIQDASVVEAVWSVVLCSGSPGKPAQGDICIQTGTPRPPTEADSLGPEPRGASQLCPSPDVNPGILGTRVGRGIAAVPARPGPRGACDGPCLRDSAHLISALLSGSLLRRSTDFAGSTVAVL